MTAKRRQTLEERCAARIVDGHRRQGIAVTVSPFLIAIPVAHIRAELTRLARAVRATKIPYDPALWLKDSLRNQNYNAALDDVLALITEAKR